jgi:hypothetical protein
MTFVALTGHKDPATLYVIPYTLHLVPVQVEICSYKTALKNKNLIVSFGKLCSLIEIFSMLLILSSIYLRRIYAISHF